jgi:flavin reductase (DIM6/NTAB) family NADH-FMN oxidoreductase RutF
MEIDPSQIEIADRYKVLIGSVTPRPIALVSTRSRDGLANLAPFSFFCGVGSNPMLIAFCPANNPDGTDKDTLRNIDPEVGGTGEFVVNIVSHAMAPRMSATAEELPHGESEWDLSGLTMAPARMVAPARVAESPIALECKLWKVIRTNPGVRGGGNMIIGEVVWVHTRDGVMDARFHADAARIDTIGRMGGPTYTRTRDRFDLPPGQAALGFVPGWPAR